MREMSKQGNFYARMRKYPSARAMYLAGNEIPEKVYDNLIESVHNALPLMPPVHEIQKELYECL